MIERNALTEMPTARLPRMAKLSLLCLGLLLTLPFLNPVHRHPLPSFYEEWWALVLGLLAAIAWLLSAPPRLVLPSLLWLPGILLCAVLAQALMGLAAGSEFILFHVGYLSWAALLATLGATLAARIGRAALFRTLAAALLVGALLSAILAYAQWLGLPLPPQVLLPIPKGMAMANVAQANVLASYLWLGIVSAMLLCEQARLARWQTLLCVLLLGSAAGLSGSRMALLHGIGLLAAAPWLSRSEPPAVRIQRLLFPGSALIALLSVRYFLPNIGSASTLDRLAQVTVSGDARLDLWRDTLTLIGEHPWLGNGIGQFPWRMVEAAALAPPGVATHPGAEHAHNFFLQLAADFGLPLALWVLVFLLIWTVRLMRSPASRHAPWGLGVLIVLGIHSLLEYPLWYADCLGLFCLVMGALDGRTRDLPLAPRQRLLLPMALAGGVAALIPLLLDYRALDVATNRPPGEYSAADWRQRIDTVASLATHSGIGGYAYIALAVLLEPESRLAKQQAYVCERGMRLWPDPVIVTRCAILRQMTGDRQGARDLLYLAQRAYRDPARQTAIRTTLELAAKKIPGAAALRESVRDPSF